MDALVMAGQLILGLTILVGLHELGHMLAAKLFGMRVEKFAIGFPPKVFGKRFGETEYMIGLIPLGGFVKISGMVDESLDTENLAEEPKPYEFRAKPAWQRLIVMLGGIIFNVITGIVIFIALTYSSGEAYLPASEAKYGVIANEVGREIGFKNGDKIVKINGKEFENFDDIFNPNVLLGKNSYYTVEREGQQLDIRIPSDFMNKIVEKEQVRFVDVALPFKVGDVTSNSAAAKAGLKKDDQIVSVSGNEIKFFQDFQSELMANAGKEAELVVLRNGSEETLNVKVGEDGKIGFRPEMLLNYSIKEYSLLEAIPVGTEKAFAVVTTNVKGLAKVIKGEVSASKSLSGPIGIAQIFGSDFHWVNFWFITGMLSMVLAFMNFLPIPALDGGHVMFLTYEMISGRKPSDKFLENSQKVGMVILLGLMGFAIFNDVFKMFF